MLASASPRKPRLATRSRSLERGDLAGGVARERERQLLARDAAAVVGDLDELRAAARELDGDLARAGVEAVFEQFLEGGGGALDDFAGGDLADQQFGQDADALMPEL